MSTNIVVVLFATIALCGAQSTMMPSLELMTKINSDMDECLKSSGARQEDIKAIWAPVTPASTEAGCLLACVMKKAGTMDSDNKINLEKQKEATKNLKNYDELVKIFEKCKFEETAETDECIAAKKHKACFVKYKTEYGVKDHF